MKEAKSKVLVIDDDESICRLIRDILTLDGVEVETSSNAEDGLDIISRKENFSIIFVDQKLPGMSGIDFLRICREKYPQSQIVIVTDNVSVEDAVQAIKLGAMDYVVKPFRKDTLLKLLSQAEKITSIERELENLRKEIKERYGFQSIVSKSKAMEKVLHLISKSAMTDSNILIYGESGTGKELVARSIHYNSLRSKGPFIPINCGALPIELIECELFGHKKGSFTGAVSDSIGLLRAAKGGTVLLDEITEMQESTQVKLLRAIQDKKVRPVGGIEEIPIDVRIIAATNNKPDEAIKQNKLRRDLYYRIAVVIIELPPLRERKEDIPFLVSHFIEKFNLRSKRKVKGVSSEVIDVLTEFDWPGNVRELENVIESAFVLGSSPIITIDDLPVSFRKFQTTPSSQKSLPSFTQHPHKFPTFDEFEKLVVKQALEISNNNKSEAAKILKISRKKLYNIVKKIESE